MKRKIKILPWILLILSVADVSCRKDNEEPLAPDYGYEYFDFTEGKTRIYEVTEINIDDQAGVYDTAHYFLKEIWAEPFADDEGRNAMKVFIYRADTCTDSLWSEPTVYWAVLTDKEAIVYEENVPFVKLCFPVETGKVWDGNKYNDNGEQEYKISSVAGDSVKVVHQDQLSLISEDTEYEVYEKNMGLIRKVIRHLEAYYDDLTVPLEQRLRYGYIYEKRLVTCN